MDQATVTLQPLNPIEKRRTYHYKSGASFSLENVEAIKIKDGYERVRTADGANGAPLQGYPQSRVFNWPNALESYRAGKSNAGGLLDGREWNEFPKAQVD